MAWTQTDLDKLKKAIARGQLQVQYADRTVRYRSLDEMLRIKSLMMEELGLARKPRRVAPPFVKGLVK